MHWASRLGRSNRFHAEAFELVRLAEIVDRIYLSQTGLGTVPTAIHKKPRRILMTVDAVGGDWNYALGLYAELGTHDIEMLLAVVGPSCLNAQRQEAEVLPNLQLVESEGRLEWMERPWEDVSRSGEWLLELEQRWKPDVIHLNSYAYGSLPWCAPRLLVGHSCVFSWWEAVLGTSPFSEWNVFQERVERGLQGVNLVIAPTRAMLDSLRRYYRWDH